MGIGVGVYVVVIVGVFVGWFLVDVFLERLFSGWSKRLVKTSKPMRVRIIREIKISNFLTIYYTQTKVVINLTLERLYVKNTSGYNFVCENNYSCNGKS